jgi:hypothetical protein
MKKINLVVIVLLILFSGCTQSREEQDEFVEYSSVPDSSSMEVFTISYPDWVEASTPDDPANLVTMIREDGLCSFQLNAVNVPVDWYTESVKEYVIEEGGRVIEEEPLIYEILVNNYTFLSKTRSVICDDKNYFVFFFCLNSTFDDETAELVFDSMNCEKNWTINKRDNKKLGMIISPANGSVISSYYEAYNKARNSGVQLHHHYVVWGAVANKTREYDWSIQDFIMDTVRYKGLDVTAVFNVIHTSIIGELPGDVVFTNWTDQEFINEFTSFVLDYIERYEDSIDYVEIGNEVDIYFNTRPDEVQDYRIFYEEVYNAIKEEYPNVKVGTVMAYHEVRKNNNEWIYSNLSLGDFDAFTLYVYSPGFLFDKDPSEMITYLEEIEELTGNRSYAIEEYGWNPSPQLEGNEEDQALAVDYFFNYLESAPDRLEFMNYFMLHDGTHEECVEQAKSFFLPDDPIIENEKYMDPFVDFICYLGLIKTDGTPRPAWNTWVNRSSEYNE